MSHSTMKDNNYQNVSGEQYYEDTVQLTKLYGGLRDVITPSNGDVLNVNQSGAVVVMGADVDVKLPTPAPGLKYKFLANADGGNAATITSTVDGSQVSNLLTGVVTDSNSMNFFDVFS